MPISSASWSSYLLYVLGFTRSNVPIHLINGSLLNYFVWLLLTYKKISMTNVHITYEIYTREKMNSKLLIRDKLLSVQK